MKFTFAPESRPLEGYTIKRAIYRGGFGEVYYALTDAGREVALKLLQNNTDVELRGVAQCLNLSHPNLVTIFDIRQDPDGDHWILMEYISGETLDAALRRYDQGMPMEEIRRWLPGLSAGVSFLHDRGIVHRDLKPGNVFIENNVVKVGDVGLSKFIAPSKRSAHTQSVGTVYYMAPEVATGKYGKEVDVYATGIMLYEMLTGHVPFDGESTGEILMKHLSAAPDLSVLPSRLRPVIGRALEKDPARRFSTVAALAEAFERAVLGRPVALEIPDASFVAPAVNGTSPHTAGTHVATRQQPGVPSPHTSQGERTILGMNLWIVLGVCGLLLSTVTGVLPLFPVGVMSVVAIVAGIRQTTAVRPPVTSVTRIPSQPPGTRPAPRAVLTPRTQRAVPLRDRTAHFCEGAATAAILTAVFTMAIIVLSPEFFATQVSHASVSLTEGPFGILNGLLQSLWGSGVMIDPGLVGLFAGTALCGAWGLLGVTKLIEGRNISLGMRRAITLLVGCVVGEAAWGLSEGLFVDLPERGNAMFSSINSNPLASEFGPTWAGYILFFGLLFGARRWWWHTDSYRPKRIRVMSVLLTMLLAWGLTAVFQFPHGWGIVWAGVISSVVQLSSAWTPPNARVEG
ncbi:MAG: serine/threonine protein kinase [Planctomycetaceae bacterium]|nr:serine/threonine protein kinase [Planctomycetaceae bacterium]